MTLVSSLNSYLFWSTHVGSLSHIKGVFPNNAKTELRDALQQATGRDQAPPFLVGKLSLRLTKLLSSEGCLLVSWPPAAL